MLITCYLPGWSPLKFYIHTLIFRLLLIIIIITIVISTDHFLSSHFLLPVKCSMVMHSSWDQPL